MIMERSTRRNTNIHPEVYPFGTSSSRRTYRSTSFSRQQYSSSQWRTSHQTSFPAYCDTGPPPTTKAPPAAKKEERPHHPHGKNAYHIWKPDRKRVCDVRSEAAPLDHTQRMTTESRDRYTRKELPRNRDTRLRRQNSSVGIVPVTSLTPETRDRLLPAKTRNQTIVMSTPAWQYSGKKREVTQPFEDHDVLYPGSAISRRSKSVGNLTSRKSSRRRQVDAPKDSLLVNGFDGAVPATSLKPSKDLWQNFNRPMADTATKRATHRSMTSLHTVTRSKYRQ